MAQPIQLKRPYRIMDVANCIVSLRPITHELLELTLYYANAYCLVNKHRCLVQEDFMKWGHGPNNKIVNSYFKDCGAAPITKPEHYLIRAPFDVAPNGIMLINPKNRILKQDDAEMIEFVTNQLYRFYHRNPFELVKITQQEPMWKPYREAIANGDIYHKYTTQEITDYFKDNQHWPWR